MVKQSAESITERIVLDRPVLAAPPMVDRVGIIHVVRWVSEGHVCKFAAQHLLDVGQHPGVAAQHAMLAADPQIAGLADRFGGWFGSFIGIGAQVTFDHKQPVELILIEAGQRQIEAGGLQVAKFKPEQFLAPLTRVRQLVVAYCVGLALRFGPAVRDDGRDLGNPLELGGLEPAVAGDQHSVLAHQHRHGPAELAQRRPDLLDLLGP